MTLTFPLPPTPRVLVEGVGSPLGSNPSLVASDSLIAVDELPVSTRNMTGVLVDLEGTETKPRANGASSDPPSFSILTSARRPPCSKNPDRTFVGDQLNDHNAEIPDAVLLELPEDRILAATNSDDLSFVHCDVFIQVLPPEFWHMVGDPVLVLSGLANSGDSNIS